MTAERTTYARDGLVYGERLSDAEGFSVTWKITWNGRVIVHTPRGCEVRLDGRSQTAYVASDIVYEGIRPGRHRVTFRRLDFMQWPTGRWGNGFVFTVQAKPFRQKRREQ